MRKEKITNCCSNSSCSCVTPQNKKKLTIDFLYLDLETCERCKGTDNNLLLAINEVKEVLKSANYEVEVNKIKINSKEIAIKYRFLSSPTIRINGKDSVEQEIIGDTTVQEKNITYPVDTKLHQKIIKKCWSIIDEKGIEVR